MLNLYCAVGIFWIFKPFFGFWPSVGASGPAAGLPYSLFQLCYHAVNVFCAGFSFFDDGNPANPLIALNGGKFIPSCNNIGI